MHSRILTFHSISENFDRLVNVDLELKTKFEKERARRCEIETETLLSFC